LAAANSPAPHSVIMGGMTEEVKITCPVCQHLCRQNSILCPECGVQFENWLKDNPDRTLPDWKPSTGPHSAKPDPIPATPPPEPVLTPEAREALIVQEMEKTVSLRNSPSIKAGRRAGGLMMTLAIGNIAMAVILKALSMTTSNTGLIMGGIDALVLTPLAIGTYMGKKKWGLWGIGYFVLSTVVSLILPSGTPVGSEMDFGAITAASNAAGNGVVALILYWFIKKME